MTQAPVSIDSLLYTTPGFRRGRPCLAGTGLTVHTIAALHLQGFSAEAICAEYPDLDPSLIYAALAYYFANREAIQRDLEADRELGARLAAADMRTKGRA
jgi:uncharacterized protein (DUF433 family)